MHIILAAIFLSAPTFSIDPTSLDKSVDACTDFYQFACGGWEKTAEIPADRPRWDLFIELLERNQATLHDILEADAKNPQPSKDDPYAQKIGDFYATCMDEGKAETASLQALKTELKRVDAVKDGNAFAALVANLQAEGVNALFDFDSDQDFKDSTQWIGEVNQAGLGLPDRDYYFKDDEKTAGIRKLYVAYVDKMFKLAGLKDKTPSATVMKIETVLAKASLTRVDLRDPQKVYHKLDRAGLVKMAPHFNWQKFFDTMKVSSQALNVAEPDFFTALNTLADKTPLSELKTYLRWHVLGRFAEQLGKAFVDENFAFSSKALTGAKQILPRWKRCVGATDRALGEALARPYVAKTFGSEGKTEAQAEIKTIEDAMGKELQALAWMDDATKKAAQTKLGKIFNMIGFPDKWRNYDALTIDRSSYLQNSARANVFETERHLARIGKPVDKTEWSMTPPTVNAYYNPQKNEMVFPAGILQPRFFLAGAARPLNYGAMGMVMGHELTHGFDDQGRQFDGDGNLSDWWSPDVSKSFDDKAACIDKQYSGYVAVDDMHVNGKLTLGENIADNGGIKLAYAAFTQLEKQKPSPVVEGFTPAQQFYLAYAQAWCSKRRDEYSRMLVNVDPHSPPKARVNGPLQNTEDFAKAFSCKAGAPMAPVNRCAVW